MKILINKDNAPVELQTSSSVDIKEAFTGVGFESVTGELLGVCLRDGGFEIYYSGEWYCLIDGKVFKVKEPLGKKIEGPIDL